MRTNTDDNFVIACAFCPQSASVINNDGIQVCPTHDEPLYVPLPDALPTANYVYLGRTLTRERAQANWQNRTPRISQQFSDGYWYSWQLLSKGR